MAWLYHYAGRPDRSAERVRRDPRRRSTPATPDGLSGNEDCGQMSSWYVFGAMGLYPVCPCTDEYVIGVPLFERVTLHLDDERVFVIRAEGAAQGAPVRDGRDVERRAADAQLPAARGDRAGRGVGLDARVEAGSGLGAVDGGPPELPCRRRAA